MSGAGDTQYAPYHQLLTRKGFVKPVARPGSIDGPRSREDIMSALLKNRFKDPFSGLSHAAGFLAAAIWGTKPRQNASGQWDHRDGMHIQPDLDGLVCGVVGLPPHSGE